MDGMLLGFGQHDLALALNRVILGFFFVAYRFRWVYDPSLVHESPWFSEYRNKKLIYRLCTCGYGSNPHIAATVALLEIGAGLALIIGFMTVPAAAGIVVVMVFANCCTPKEEIPLMNPVDRLDWVACYFRLVEPLYLLMAVVVVVSGPGRWSLDAWLWR